MTTKKTFSRIALSRASCALLLAALPAACSDGSHMAGPEPEVVSSETAVNAHPSGRQLLSGHVPAAAATAPIVRRLDPAKTMSLAIGLPLRDVAGLKRVAASVSDPSSASYRHYLTPAEVAAAYGPTESDYAATADFARAHGLRVLQTFSNRVVLHVTGAAADVERALNVQMNVHRRDDGTEFYAPDVEPSLDLDVPVLHIAGLDDVEKPHPTGSRSTAAPVTKLGGSGPLGLYVGADLRTAYASCTTDTGAGQTLGLMEFDGYTPSDVVAYNQYGGGQRQVPLNNVLIAGATASPAPAPTRSPRTSNSPTEWRRASRRSTSSKGQTRSPRRTPSSLR